MRNEEKKFKNHLVSMQYSSFSTMSRGHRGDLSLWDLTMNMTKSGEPYKIVDEYTGKKQN